MSKRKSFTLIELTVVIAIIIIILSMVLPLLGSTWRDVQFNSAISKVKAMLTTARARASTEVAFGICFYTSPTGFLSTEKQYAVFVKWAGAPSNNPDPRYSVNMADTDSSYWPAYAGRFVADRNGTDGRYALPESFRVRNITIGQPKSNIFMIIFNRDGSVRFPKWHFMLHDPYSDSDDFGEGDPAPVGITTNMPISDITGSWCNPSDCRFG